MSDVSKRDMANAEANITGALKEKRYSKAMETTFKSDYFRSYNNYPLYTDICDCYSDFPNNGII